jgi:histidine triad (HIT) family protein
MMTRFKTILLALASVLVGVVLGGYLFSDTRPRSILAMNRCGGTCLQVNELAGLLTSVAIQRLTPLVPAVVKETDKTIVVEHPSPQARLHYLIIPKKDIKNIGEFSEADREHLIDSFNVVREIIKENNLTDYRVTTNGPGYQGVTYLHFHLTSR